MYLSILENILKLGEFCNELRERLKAKEREITESLLKALDTALAEQKKNPEYSPKQVLYLYWQMLWIETATLKCYDDQVLQFEKLVKHILHCSIDKLITLEKPEHLRAVIQLAQNAVCFIVGLKSPSEKLPALLHEQTPYRSFNTRLPSQDNIRDLIEHIEVLLHLNEEIDGLAYRENSFDLKQVEDIRNIAVSMRTEGEQLRLICKALTSELYSSDSNLAKVFDESVHLCQMADVVIEAAKEKDVFAGLVKLSQVNESVNVNNVKALSFARMYSLLKNNIEALKENLRMKAIEKIKEILDGISEDRFQERLQEKFAYISKLPEVEDFASRLYQNLPPENRGVLCEFLEKPMRQDAQKRVLFSKLKTFCCDDSIEILLKLSSLGTIQTQALYVLCPVLKKNNTVRFLKVQLK